ncbi:hypothetical protein WA158_003637 [Blastocystis sp. Blastoise]
MSDSEHDSLDLNEEEVEMEKKALEAIKAERSGKNVIEMDKEGLKNVAKHLEKQLPWDEVLDMSVKLPEIENPDDDIQRELAFYEATLSGVTEARHLLKENDIPFLKPQDFLCEMVKDDGHMNKIEKHKERLELEKKEKIRNIIKQKKNKQRKNPKKYSRRR